MSMGTYTFTWEHAADEVIVTGDFDGWEKSVQLEKEDGVFKKTVELPKQKHQYKFFVDGNWCTNDSAPKEDDGSGNYNNILNPDDINEPIATLSSAAPGSTTAALAAAVRKEDAKPKSEEAPPAASPATEAPSKEPQAISVNPIPATDGPGNPIKLEPGEKVPDPSTLTSNTIESTVKLDKEPAEETVGVAPIPATAGLGNPIHLEPGEKVPDPSTLTSNTVSSTAKTDAESYEKSDALPPQPGSVVTPEAKSEAKGGSFDLPPAAGAIIPESSLPINADAKTEQDPGVTIQSAAPTSTTAALAGAVPIEPRGVPETVTESQKEAGFTPEASANPETVEEKKEVEQELKEKVAEEPPVAESSTATEQVAAAPAAGAFAAATYAAKEKAAEAIGLNGQATAGEVPEVVAESQEEAHASPEASANPEAVEEKKEVEQELKEKVAEEPPATESSTTEQVSAAAASDATAGAGLFTAATYTAKEKAAEAVGLNGQATAGEVPEIVAESQKEAHASPEASTNPEAVEEKKEVESELLKEVQKTEKAGEPAPTATAVTSETAPVEAAAGTQAQPEAAKPTIDSRDISPMSKQPTTEQTQPASKTDAKTAPEAPKNAPESAKANSESVSSSAAADKKKKRRSFFSKLKEKFSSKA